MKKLRRAIAAIGLLAAPAAFAVDPVPLAFTAVCADTGTGEVVIEGSLDRRRAS